MTALRREGRAATLAAALLLTAAAGPAGQEAANGAAPAPAPLAVPQAALPLPPTPVIVLPSATPSPASRARPRPTRTPIPRAAPSPIARPARVAAAPVPSATVGTVADRPTAPGPSVVPGPSTAPSFPAPAVPAPPAIGPAAVEGAGAAGYWLAALVAVAIAAALGWVLSRRRAAAEAGPSVDEATGIGETPPPLAPSSAPPPRARLTLAFRPVRAGINLLSATSENEIVLGNIGDAPAEDIRVIVRLFSAHGGQEADLAAFHAAPAGRPAALPFALAPGETRSLSAVAALPREAIHTLVAAGRPMLVPIVAVNVRYLAAGHEEQVARAFAVGVERVDSAKLAPFWLDAPVRTCDQVAARPLER